MANTYTQIHLQFIFAPKFRKALIDPAWENDLYKYITGIIQNHKHKVIWINGMPDHIHILIGFHTSQTMADLMQIVKKDSSNWINQNKLTQSKFEWQTGYGAFSCSKSQLPNLIAYVQNQKQHHKKYTFLEEYKKLLENFDIPYDEQYIFKLPE